MSAERGGDLHGRDAQPPDRVVPEPGPLHATRMCAASPSGADHLPLVLLHGFTGEGGTWAPLVGALEARADFQREVWAVDLIGHGRSPKPGAAAEHTIPAQAAAVAESMAAHGVPRAVWLGYSMGGRVTLTLAAHHPEAVAAQILVGASPGIADPAARAARVAADERLAAAIERDGLADFVDRWAALPIFASQARLGAAHAQRMRAQRLRNDPAALATSLRNAGQGRMPPLFDALRGMSMPTLLVSGAEDEKYVRLARELDAALPDSEAHILSRAGHAVQLEQPEALALLVAGWLDR